jgi:XTP/dITP diphosphohydrolase
LKANAIGVETGLPVLAEDAGLEVDALAGAPGVCSARFAGLPVDYAANNDLLLERLRGVGNRRARFVTVAILLLPDGRSFEARGTLHGTIAEAPSGTGGFGYDPLFVPDGMSRTLAEIGENEKNRISHRMRAIEQMRPILSKLVEKGELAV